MVWRLGVRVQDSGFWISGLRNEFTVHNGNLNGKESGQSHGLYTFLDIG